MDAYLSCNQCGKCCNSGPSLAFSEIFKYQDKFVMGLFCQAQSDRAFPADKVDESLIIDHLGKLFGRLNTWQGGIFLQFFPMDIGYSILQGYSCDHLDPTGACALHDDKPSMCRSVPFDPVLPESQQAFKLDSFMSLFECASSEGSDENLIYRDGQITNESYRRGFEAKLKDFQDNVKYQSLMAHWANSDDSFLPPVQYFIDAANRGARVEVSIIFYLTAYLNENPNQKQQRTQQIIDFCDSQITLTENLISKAVSRKVKSDLERTRALRENIHQLKTMRASCLDEMKY